MSLIDEFLNYQKCEKLNIISKEPILDEYGDEVIIDSYKTPYLIKYHINEIIKRITCTEKNKPTIDKEKMKPGMTKSQLYKIMTYQQRKSLIYIWCTLNNEKQLILKLQDYRLIKKLTA